MSTNSQDSPPRPPVVHLMGVDLDAFTNDSLPSFVAAELAAGRGGWVVTPNLEILRRCATNTDERALVARATVRVPDGMPLIWASRLKRTPLPERVAGSDLIWSLTAQAARLGHRVYFLGGNPKAAEGAAATLLAKHPTLVIAGTHCPEFGFENDPAKIAHIADEVMRAMPDIVFVALGFPKQEHLTAAIRDAVPKAWFLGIGISFSFVTGEVQRAPMWIQRLGFEWLHRMIQEPGRLMKRYLVDGLPFALRLFVWSAWRGLRGN
ncbi:MAG: WecB/TagA/CpsF family glycosyltransferase [Phycisphaerales bacterium]|nr:MAG: WecB/TagA/CpsF family glycosyltransferase [Phycisphaerales bacterium]